MYRTNTTHYNRKIIQLTNLELTVFVDEDIGRLQITMNDVGGMNKLQGSKYLIDEKPEVFFGQNLV